MSMNSIYVVCEGIVFDRLALNYTFCTSQISSKQVNLGCLITEQSTKGGGAAPLVRRA